MIKKTACIFCVIFSALASAAYGKTVFISENADMAGFLTGRGISRSDIYAFSNEAIQNLAAEDAVKLKTIAAKNKITVAGTTYRDIDIPLLLNFGLENDAVQQIEKGRSAYFDVFGSSPSVFYPFDGKFDEKTLRVAAAAGYSSVVSTSGAVAAISTTGSMTTSS